MTKESVKLRIKVDAGPDVGAEKLQQLTYKLRKELLKLNVTAVDLESGGEIPEGVKGDPVTVGTILVTLLASGGVITALIDVLKTWIKRQEKRSVTVEIGGDKISLNAIPSREQQELLETFLKRHNRD